MGLNERPAAGAAPPARPPTEPGDAATPSPPEDKQHVAIHGFPVGTVVVCDYLLPTPLQPWLHTVDVGVVTMPRTRVADGGAHGDLTEHEHCLRDGNVPVTWEPTSRRSWASPELLRAGSLRQVRPDVLRLPHRQRVLRLLGLEAFGNLVAADGPPDMLELDRRNIDGIGELAGPRGSLLVTLIAAYQERAVRHEDDERLGEPYRVAERAAVSAYQRLMEPYPRQRRMLAELLEEIVAAYAQAYSHEPAAGATTTTEGDVAAERSLAMTHMLAIYSGVPEALLRSVVAASSVATGSPASGDEVPSTTQTPEGPRQQDEMPERAPVPGEHVLNPEWRTCPELDFSWPVFPDDLEIVRCPVHRHVLVPESRKPQAPTAEPAAADPAADPAYRAGGTPPPRRR